MTAPISGNRAVLPLAQTAPSEALTQQPAAAVVGTALKQGVSALREASSFTPAGLVAGRSAALLGGVADAVAQKGLGAQASALDRATRALATVQANIQQVAGLVSNLSSPMAGLQGAAVGALAGTAQMPMNIANSVAGAINGGSDMRQLDVLQGMAYTDGPLAASNVETGDYSADALGGYADPGEAYADPSMYEAPAADVASPLSQLFGPASDLVGGVGDALDLRDQFRKPSNAPQGPDSRISTPETHSPGKPTGAGPKVSTPEFKMPGIKPSALAGSADDIAKIGLKTGGKALGRFVPGLNVAMAGMDLYNAVETFKNPNSSLADKITSGLAAGGSLAAATNIPIVSQVGGLISTGASIAGELINHGGELKDVANTVGDAAKKVGEGIKDTAEKVGHEVKDTAQKVGEGIKDTAQKVGEGIKDTAQKVGEGIKNFFSGW